MCECEVGRQTLTGWLAGWLAALLQANSVEYGLGSSVFSKDYARAERIAAALATGKWHLIESEGEREGGRHTHTQTNALSPLHVLIVTCISCPQTCATSTTTVSTTCASPCLLAASRSVRAQVCVCVCVCVSSIV